MIAAAGKTGLAAVEGAVRQVFHAFYWKGGFALVPAVIATHFHAEAAVFLIWFAFAVLDFLFGVLRAVVYHAFKRQRLYHGVLKLVTHIFLIALVGYTYQAFFLSTGVRLPLVNFFVLVLLATDAISITNHMARLGLPVPPFAKSVVWKLRLKALSGVAAGLDTDVDSLCRGAADGWGVTERRQAPREGARDE